MSALECAQGALSPGGNRFRWEHAEIDLLSEAPPGAPRAEGCPCLPAAPQELSSEVGSGEESVEKRAKKRERVHGERGA